MIFLKKNKPINVKFLTSSEHVYQTSKPNRAVKFMPEWFQNFHPQIEDGITPRPTVKGCRGLIDLYSKGIILQSWCEVAFEIGEIGSNNHSWQFADYKSVADVHNRHQFPRQINFNNLAHVKLISPWRIICDEDIQWSWQEPIWNDFSNYAYKVIPGVTEFKYQHNANINLMFKRQLGKSYKHFIKHNSPLVHMIPISDRKTIKVSHECVSDREFKNLDIPQVSFLNNYLNMVKAKKNNYANS